MTETWGFLWQEAASKNVMQMSVKPRFNWDTSLQP